MGAGACAAGTSQEVERSGHAPLWTGSEGWPNLESSYPSLRLPEACLLGDFRPCEVAS